MPHGSDASQLGGDLNVAVARFQGVGSPDAAAHAELLSESLVSGLRERTQEDPGGLRPAVEVAGPDQLEDLNMAPPLGQPELERLNATLGVTGRLRSEPQVSVLSTATRIDTRQLHLARQIDPVIRRRIRMPGSVDESIATRIRLRNQLLRSINLIGDLLLGLGELEGEHPRRAQRLLGGVLAAWPALAGSEALYLILGHAFADQGRDVEARESYRRALGVHPGYVRARFALAALDFRHAAEDCSEVHTDVAALRTARGTFERLAERTVSTLRVKALFARGRADVCLSQADLSRRFDLARAAFAQVVQAYRGGTPDIRAEAAESLGWLAFIALPPRGIPPARERRAIAAAVRLYRRAASLAVDPARRRSLRAQADRWSRRLHLDREASK